eukprot:scaffold120826_cov28-Tisochrysis_lutea.AAC.1
MPQHILLPKEKGQPRLGRGAERASQRLPRCFILFFPGSLSPSLALCLPLSSRRGWVWDADPRGKSGVKIPRGEERETERVSARERLTPALPARVLLLLVGIFHIATGGIGGTGRREEEQGGSPDSVSFRSGQGEYTLCEVEREKEEGSERGIKENRDQEVKERELRREAGPPPEKRGKRLEDMRSEAESGCDDEEIESDGAPL